MGWMFTFDKTTRKEMVDYLRRPERFEPHWELLKSSAVGNNHWYLARDKRDGRVWIGLDLMQGGGKTGHGWGWKDLSEDMGPVETNCPITYLDLASPATEGYAAEWRKRVRIAHAAKKSRPAPAPGKWIEYGGNRYRLDYVIPGRRKWHITGEDGMYYGLSFNRLGRATFIDEPKSEGVSA